MWHVSAERRGTTLVELLIYSVLFVFILGIVYASLVMGLDAYRRTENFATVQQQAMTSLHALTDELASSPRSAVRYETGTTGAVLLLSARDASGRVQYDSTGKALWQAWVAYKLVPGRGLVRSEKALTPTADVPGTVPTPTEINSDNAATHRTVSGLVEVLEFTPGTSATEVHLQAANDLRGRTSVDVRDRVFFRQ